MASDNFITLKTGVDSWFKALFILLALLSMIGILLANTAWFIKISGLLALGLFLGFTRWQLHHQESFYQLEIFGNGTVSLFGDDGEEFPGILDCGSWTTRWVSIVPVGRFDRWRTQGIIVCASRNRDSEYRQLLKILRLGAGTRERTGIIGWR